MTQTEPKTRKNDSNGRNKWVARAITVNLSNREAKNLDEIIRLMRLDSPRATTTDATQAAINHYHAFLTGK